MGKVVLSKPYQNAAQGSGSSPSKLLDNFMRSNPFGEQVITLCGVGCRTGGFL